MKLFTETKENLIQYADTVIENVDTASENVLVSIESYDQEKVDLAFQQATLIKVTSELPERVETAQLLKLKNKNKRLILFNDDLEIILEIEFNKCA